VGNGGQWRRFQRGEFKGEGRPWDQGYAAYLGVAELLGSVGRGGGRGGFYITFLVLGGRDDRGGVEDPEGLKTLGSRRP